MTPLETILTIGLVVLTLISLVTTVCIILIQKNIDRLNKRVSDLNAAILVIEHKERIRRFDG